MTLSEICAWLTAVDAKPCPPAKLAEELELCDRTTLTMVNAGQLWQALQMRFFNGRRRQLTDTQNRAIRTALDFGVDGGASARAFLSLNRARIALQLIARVLDPSRVSQGQYQLCGPASVAIALLRTSPLSYVEACVELADRGRATFGNLVVSPRREILAHSARPEADWIMLASLRNDDRAIESGGYGISGGYEMFDWLVGCGFRNVLLMIDYPFSIMRSSPSGLLPPHARTSDKRRMLITMCGLSARGWNLFLFAFGDIADQARVLSSQEQQAREASADPAHLGIAGDMLTRANDRAAQILGRANPSALTLMWRVLTGTVGQNTLHLTNVHKISIDGNLVRLTCSNYGAVQRGVSLPIEGFVNKLAGFAAATDIV